MEKIIHINNSNLFALNKINQLGNFEELAINIETNFQYTLFSTIFMSGAEYIQLDKSLVDKNIIENPFWKNKFIETLTPNYLKVINKASRMMIPHLKWINDGLPLHPHNLVLSSYLGDLLHCSETGIPSVISRFKTEEDQEWIKPAVTLEFYQNFVNFQKLFKQEDIDTIAPKFSVLKKEVRIFEDISASPLYRDYQNLHNELKYSDKISKIIKEIKVFSLKLHYKYLGNFDLKKTTFSHINDSFSSIESIEPNIKAAKISLDILEHILSGNKKVNFYGFEDADFFKLLDKRLNTLSEKGDIDTQELIKILQKK